MDFSIKLGTFKQGWYIVHIERSNIIVSKNGYIFRSFKFDIVHLGLHCLQVSVLGFRVFKGLN